MPARLRDDVGDEPLVGRAVRARDNHGRANVRVLHQGRLDLARLDAEAADLDLQVGPAEEVDASIRQVAGQVAGAIEPLARSLREWIRDELLGCESPVR